MATPASKEGVDGSTAERGDKRPQLSVNGYPSPGPPSSTEATDDASCLARPPAETEDTKTDAAGPLPATPSASSRYAVASAAGPPAAKSLSSGRARPPALRDDGELSPASLGAASPLLSVSSPVAGASGLTRSAGAPAETRGRANVTRRSGSLSRESTLSRASSVGSVRRLPAGIGSGTQRRARTAMAAIEVRGDLVVNNVSSLQELMSLLEDENSPFVLQMRDVELRVGTNQVARLGDALPALREHLQALQREQETTSGQRTRSPAGARRVQARPATPASGSREAARTATAPPVLRTGVAVRGTVEGRRSAVVRSRLPPAAEVSVGTRYPIVGGVSRPVAALGRRLPSGALPSPSAALPSATEVRAANALARARQLAAEAGSASPSAQDQSQSILQRLSEVQQEVKSLLASEGVVTTGDTKKKGKGEASGDEGEDAAVQRDAGGKGATLSGIKVAAGAKHVPNFGASSSSSSAGASSTGLKGASADKGEKRSVEGNESSQKNTEVEGMLSKNQGSGAVGDTQSEEKDTGLKTGDRAGGGDNTDTHEDKNATADERDKEASKVHEEKWKNAEEAQEQQTTASMLVNQVGNFFFRAFSYDRSSHPAEEPETQDAEKEEEKHDETKGQTEETSKETESAEEKEESEAEK
ncbi:hypothetical protein BESB_047560 [Besnoitia besnoiti]|uniref:Uncharacterized protein n=1 Tax=Besnoitia besnoiti TaxID=94643 RepID=A0A2A9MHC0_BESBE|nr:hypothetical protein BESB_047560 [Besnoitia besnoiti]PFH36564.1 hypothetical protein BESB_047560 [Besnoitia besnoiti]